MDRLAQEIEAQREKNKTLSETAPTQVSADEAQLNALKEEIEGLKAKNDEIRKRNWLVIDELTSTQDTLEKTKAELDQLRSEQAHKRLLQSRCLGLLARPASTKRCAAAQQL